MTLFQARPGVPSSLLGSRTMAAAGCCAWMRRKMSIVARTRRSSSNTPWPAAALMLVPGYHPSPRQRVPLNSQEMTIQRALDDAVGHIRQSLPNAVSPRHVQRLAAAHEDLRQTLVEVLRRHLVAGPLPVFMCYIQQVPISLHNKW
jgi:hypothetical protein